MPRRYRPPRRKIIPDARYSSVLVAHFINKIMRGGKKSTATRIMYDAMDIVGEQMKRQPLEVLAHLLLATTDEAALFIANANDPAAARDQAVGALDRLLSGIKGP